jgi:16S rRNA (adenine1518-N6/adenine1519-N6)-dimethyltransferase
VPADHPRALLAAHGVRAKKRLGQNFLMDGAAATRIARLTVDAPPSDDGVRAVEIGAGTGALTLALLLEGARVTALEIDPELVGVLRSRDDLAAATVVRADALAFDYAGWAGGKDWRAAGNLPYNVATPLLLQLIEMRGGPSTIVAMIQKDVADRLAAKPGTPAYGSLSIVVQYAMHVEKAFTLGPRSFYPQPKVHSTVVRLRRRDVPAASPRDEALFLQVVRAAFAYRRKTLANSLTLALGGERSHYARAIERAGLASEIRGEHLAIVDFARLADELAEGRI